MKALRLLTMCVLFLSTGCTIGPAIAGGSLVVASGLSALASSGQPAYEKADGRTSTYHDRSTCNTEGHGAFLDASRFAYASDADVAAARKAWHAAYDRCMVTLGYTRRAS